MKLQSVQSDLDDVLDFKKDKIRMDKELEDLEKQLKQEERRRKEECGQMEVEKVEATEKLRKQMLYQIKKTKANLLALNDEQLAKTTRLTMLQNDQLSNELELQSKSTEAIVA